MAIKYPGEQKIGYGKAQIFDTSKLAEGAWKAGEKLSLKRKEKKKAKDEAALFKEKVRGDADRIYQDKTTLVVRPGSEEASCYYGQGTKWCISATEARNYWDQYTGEQGAVFFFILDKEAADEDKMGTVDRGKVAFVYDGDHLEANDPWDAYDETDDQLAGGEALHDYKQISGEEK